MYDTRLTGDGVEQLGLLLIKNLMSWINGASTVD